MAVKLLDEDDDVAICLLYAISQCLMVVTAVPLGGSLFLSDVSNF